LDCFSCSLAARTRGRLWQVVTKFNENHGAWAWFSLIWIGFADFYVRLVSSGVIGDPRLILISA
ncbi:MAG: succinate dehydrogenase, partial [Chloroflexota bacterium]|nr:succinate dehydrogenase [Chloroflexota bacterium]